MATQVTKSFTSETVSDTLYVPERGKTVAFALSGTYAATIVVERAKTPEGTAWEVVLGPYSTANATVAASYVSVRENEKLRIRAKAYTSGTAVTSITDSETVLQTQGDATTNYQRTTLGHIFNGAFRVQNAAVAAGSTKTLTLEEHADKLILLDTLTGSVVTLPAATGSGAIYRFLVSVLATSNSHVVKVANSTDILVGSLAVMGDTGNTPFIFFTASTSDTITLNRTTTGSVTVGEYIEITDYAAGKFLVQGVISANGTEATPFSATV